MSVAACAVLAVAGFGGAYALAHENPVEPARAPGSPTMIRLEDDSIGALRRVSPLPALIVPPPRPKPADPEPVVEDPPSVVPAAAQEPAFTPAPAPAPAPAATPTPTPKPQAPAKKPLTFDDSG